MTDWQTVKLGDVAYEVSERVDNPSTSGYDRFVGLEHFVSGDFRITSWGTTENLISAMKLFKAGDTLFARRNAYLKRASMADFDGICSGDAIVLRNNEKMIDGFLPLILNTDHFWNYAIANAAGSMSKRVRVEDLMKYEFPLPPVDEQRRIADLLWAADDEIDSFRQLFDETGKLEASLKLSIFSASNHKIKLGSLVEEGKLSFKTGPFGTVLKASSYVEKGVPVVNPVNMSDGKFYVEDGPFISEQEAKRLEIYKIFENDLIFGRKGDIGRGIFATKESEGYLFGSDCICVRVIEKSVLPKYLFYFLTSPNSKRLLSAQSHGTTMPGINEKMLSRMEISIPDESEQLAIIKKLEQVDETKSQIQERISKSTDLKKALLQKLLS